MFLDCYRQKCIACMHDSTLLKLGIGLLLLSSHTHGVHEPERSGSAARALASHPIEAFPPKRFVRLKRVSLWSIHFLSYGM
jgi:hypothetical protein